MTMATINSSIVLISLPAIFRGIGLDPLDPGNVSYLLWMLLGFLLVTAALVVTFGRLGDIYGRVRIYNLGFLVFAVLVDRRSRSSRGTVRRAPLAHRRGAVVQAVGAAMIMANATAILTDAFPLHQRGTALGINQVAAIAGSFLGLVLGGVLSEWHWRAVFWVSVPFGVARRDLVLPSRCTRSARGTGASSTCPATSPSPWGSACCSPASPTVMQPYGGSSMGWTNPWVFGVAAGRRRPAGGLRRGRGAQRRPDVPALAVQHPGVLPRQPRPVCCRRSRAAGSSSCSSSGCRASGCPSRGYSYESTPLWASIFLLPLTVGFLAAGPLSGFLSDRYGARRFAVAGALVAAVSFLGLMVLPVDFAYRRFAALIFLNGVGFGMFSSPNTAVIMNAVPAAQRGVASGMRMTFFNSGSALSIGIFFSLMVIGLAASLPEALTAGLTGQGVPVSDGATSWPGSRRWASCSRRSSASTRSARCSPRPGCSPRCRPRRWPPSPARLLPGTDRLPLPLGSRAGLRHRGAR